MIGVALLLGVAGVVVWTYMRAFGWEYDFLGDDVELFDQEAE